MTDREPSQPTSACGSLGDQTRPSEVEARGDVLDEVKSTWPCNWLGRT